MLTYNNVSKIYPPDIVALHEASFEVRPGEFLSLVGKSGAGKSTILKMLLVEERPTSGEVLLDGTSIEEIDGSQLPEFRRNLGVVFQDFRLLNSKTVYENVAYVMEVMGMSDEVIERETYEVLDIVGLPHKAFQFPYQLSGGEKQRVAIARAFIHRPKIIIADEPTGNLDPYHTRDIMKLMVKVHEMGTTVMMATHNKDVINRLGKRVISLEDGKIVRDEEKGRFVI